MAPEKAFQQWKRMYELSIRGEIVGYDETTYGICIRVRNATGETGIPYAYKDDYAVLL